MNTRLLAFLSVIPNIINSRCTATAPEVSRGVGVGLGDKNNTISKSHADLHHNFIFLRDRRWRTSPPRRPNSTPEWERKWMMSFNPSKCEVIHITKKRNPIIHTYKIHQSTNLSKAENTYLGVSFANNLSWNIHTQSTTRKANNSLSFLRRNITSCPQDIKAQSYKTLVRPILEYACRHSLGPTYSHQHQPAGSCTEASCPFCERGLQDYQQHYCNDGRPRLAYTTASPLQCQAGDGLQDPNNLIYI